MTAKRLNHGGNKHGRNRGRLNHGGNKHGGSRGHNKTGSYLYMACMATVITICTLLLSLNWSFLRNNFNNLEKEKHNLGTKNPTKDASILNLPLMQTLCELSGFQVVCHNEARDKPVTADPMFAEYYTGRDGTHILKPATPQLRPIATNWFQPNVARFCGNDSSFPCANLGDELGPMLLLKLSGQKYVENRYDGMDVVIIGSVLNFIVTEYNRTVQKVGNYFNMTVWGAGTK